MVKNVYDYWVNPDNYDAATSDAKRLYGFDEDGAMLVGWNSRDLDTTWNNPTADDKGKSMVLLQNQWSDAKSRLDEIRWKLVSFCRFECR